jgi:hypothetical protein
LIALAGPAISADLRDLVYDAPSWSWTGCYVGGHAGGLWSSQQWINQTPSGDFFGQSLGGHDVESWVAGVQAGSDYQFVIGAHGDYAWTGAEGSHPSVREFSVFYHSDIDLLATVTGRIGYAWDRFLGYVRRRLAARRLLGDDPHPGDCLYGERHAVGLDDRRRRRISLHQTPVRFRRIQLLRLGRPAETPQAAGLRRAFVDLEESTSVVRAGLNFRFGHR